jgi:hypothetical protein
MEPSSFSLAALGVFLIGTSYTLRKVRRHLRPQPPAQTVADVLRKAPTPVQYLDADRARLARGLDRRPPGRIADAQPLTVEEVLRPRPFHRRKEVLRGNN